MDARGGRATSGVNQLEDGQNPDRSEIKADRAGRRNAKQPSEETPPGRAGAEGEEMSDKRMRPIRLIPIRLIEPWRCAKPPGWREYAAMMRAGNEFPPGTSHPAIIQAARLSVSAIRRLSPNSSGKAHRTPNHRCPRDL